MTHVSNDPRYLKLRRGLEQLNKDQLRRLLNTKQEMVLDGYLYHEGKF